MARSRAAVVQFILSIFLLAACPLPAFAIDTDGDGVDDSVDAFPNHPEATVDTDGDGMPDEIVEANIPVFENFEQPLVGWAYDARYLGRVSGGAHFHSGSYGGGYVYPNPGTRGFEKTTTAGTVTFWRYRSYPSLYVDGVQQTISCAGTTGWNKCSASFQSGVHVLRFVVWTDCVMMCTTQDIDDISVSALTIDGDDDNDGVADGSDAFPLNATESVDTDNDGTGNNADIDDDNDGLPDVMDPLPLQAKFNVDANYKGSQVRDGAQPE